MGYIQRLVNIRRLRIPREAPMPPSPRSLLRTDGVLAAIVSVFLIVAMWTDADRPTLAQTSFPGFGFSALQSATTLKARDPREIARIAFRSTVLLVMNDSRGD